MSKRSNWGSCKDVIRMKLFCSLNHTFRSKLYHKGLMCKLTVCMNNKIHKWKLHALKWHTIVFNRIAHILLLNLHNPDNNVVIYCQRHGCVNPVCIFSYKCVEMGCISANSEVCKQRKDTTEDCWSFDNAMYMQCVTKQTVYSIYCICSTRSNMTGVSDITIFIIMQHKTKFRCEFFCVQWNWSLFICLFWVWGNGEENKWKHNIHSDGLLRATTLDITGSRITYFWDRLQEHDN